MGNFAIHVASEPDRKGGGIQPDKVVHAGSRDLENAKEIADEAFAQKVRGPNTQAYVMDCDTEERVYTAGK
jgi:hypothetical protein